MQQFEKLRLLVYIIIFAVIPLVEILGSLSLSKGRHYYDKILCHCRARHGNLLPDYRVKPDNDRNIMPNNDRISFILLLSLLVFFALTELLYLTVFSKTGEKKRHQQEIQLLHEADISQVDGIIIQGGEEGLIFTRKNNRTGS